MLWFDPVCSPSPSRWKSSSPFFTFLVAPAPRDTTRTRFVLCFLDGAYMLKSTARAAARDQHECGTAGRTWTIQLLYCYLHGLMSKRSRSSSDAVFIRGSVLFQPKRFVTIGTVVASCQWSTAAVLVLVFAIVTVLSYGYFQGTTAPRYRIFIAADECYDLFIGEKLMSQLRMHFL